MISIILPINWESENILCGYSSIILTGISPPHTQSHDVFQSIGRPLCRLQCCIGLPPLTAGIIVPSAIRSSPPYPLLPSLAPPIYPVGTEGSVDGRIHTDLIRDGSWSDSHLNSPLLIMWSVCRDHTVTWIWNDSWQWVMWLSSFKWNTHFTACKSVSWWTIKLLN